MLTLNFTTPGSGTAHYSANVSALAVVGIGIASIDFDPNTQLILLFQNGQSSGSFNLTVNDLALADTNRSGPGSPVNLVGTVSTAAVPEPATMTLLAFGLAGVGARRWRQRRA